MAVSSGPNSRTISWHDFFAVRNRFDDSNSLGGMSETGESALVENSTCYSKCNKLVLINTLPHMLVEAIEGVLRDGGLHSSKKSSNSIQA